MPKGKEYTVARLERAGTFEILVDPDNALRYKRGERIPMSNIVVYEEIYKDAKKGIRAGEEETRKVFGTNDFTVVAAKILDEGELQITADQRRKLIEDKKRQIVEFISRNSVDPRTSLPHPPQRIELALQQAGLSIDPFQDAKMQAMKMLERLRSIIPIKMGVVKMSVIVRGDAMSKCHSYLKNTGKILNQAWLPDGRWSCTVEIPAGLQMELTEKLGSISAGSAEVKPLEG